MKSLTEGNHLNVLNFKVLNERMYVSNEIGQNYKIRAIVW